jgi:hypothetical protein
MKTTSNRGLYIKVDNTSAIRKILKEIGGIEVLAGVPSDSEQPHRAAGAVGPNERFDNSGFTNAQLAAIHDRGEPAANIPARPFMIPGFERVKDAAQAHMKVGAVGALSGDKTLLDIGANQAGIAAVDGIRQTIDDRIPPPLSPVTLARRRARGVMGTVPLVDTTKLRSSISYIIRKG